MNYLRKTNIILSLFTLITIPIFYVGCLEEDEPKAPVDQLPPLTTTGENTFGCLINGEALIVMNTLEITAIYQGGVLQLGGGVENDLNDIDITFNLEDPITENMPYDLTKSPMYLAWYRDKNSVQTCNYSYENTFEGTLGFSKIDRTNFIISGIFDFSTVTQDCDTVRITNGRFDVQYTP